MSRFFRFLSVLVLLSMLIHTPAAEGAALPAQSSRGLGFFHSPPGRSFHVPPGQAKKIEYENAILEIDAGSVTTETSITIAALSSIDLPPLDLGMSLVTGGPRSGYRMLPHNTKFKKNITIKLPYDPDLIPSGQTEEDLQTFFYDDQTESWQALERVQVDTEQKLVISLSDHFTDFINATLTVPDHPETLSFNPNSIKDIQAADPGAGINLIEPPQGNSMGNASLSYPIQVPPGRGGMQPNLSIAYNSGGSNGWMGLGWDLQLPAVGIETRWGVPRYDPAWETETYLLNGGQLTPLAHRSELVARKSGDVVFYERVEGAFARIVRHGTGPKNYWWEITDKNGRTSIYGDPPGTASAGTATLADDSGNVFKWALRETRDLNGNSVSYHYVLVSDPGIEGSTVPGRQLYPESIQYTHADGAIAPYSIRFTLDPDPGAVPAGGEKRPDAIIDARGGFKMVTAARLDRISVLYRDELIRAYAFDYEEGAFSKSLLRSITQLGADGLVFNTHSFAYYDEVQAGAGFQAAETWTLGEDHVSWLTGAVLKEVLLPNLNLNLGDGNATALSGTVSDSYGTHLYTGWSPGPTKWVSAGLKGGYNYSQTSTVLALIDINGDGLLDKVFQSGGGLYYRLNLTRPGEEPMFGEPGRIAGINEISKERSETWSAGAEVYVGVSAFDNYSNSTTTSSVYFTDANADGLPDLAKDGKIYFNHLEKGVPTFTEDSRHTQVALARGVDAKSVEVTQLDLMNYHAAVDSYPLLDTLRRWTAPFAGVVTITAPVQLIQGQEAGDGVRVAIQHNARELWSVTIGGEDYEPYNPTGVRDIKVAKGDRIYFRVQSVDNGLFDQVRWDPIIQYNTAETVTDVNGLNAYRYQASEEFTLGGRPGIGFQAPFTGEVLLSGDFQKLAQTTDDIRLVITLNNDTVFDQSMAWDKTGTIPVQVPLDVVNDIENDSLSIIRLRMEIDSPVDLAALTWRPRLSYTSLESGGDPSGMAPFFLPYDIDMYPMTTLAKPQESWTATKDGELTVRLRFAASAPASQAQSSSAQLDSSQAPYKVFLPTINRKDTSGNGWASLAAADPGKVTFTVKRAGEPAADPPEMTVGDLLAKRIFTPQGEAPVEIELTVDVKQGDVLYFDYSVHDPDLEVHSAAVQVKYAGGASITVPSAVHSAAKPDLFAPLYRGWAYAGYNGNNTAINQPLPESSLVYVPPKAGEEEEYDLASALAFPFSPVPGAKPEQDVWGGVDDLAYASANTISSSRLGVDSIIPPVNPVGGAAPLLISKTKQNALGLGLGPASASYSGYPALAGVDPLEGLPALGTSYNERDFIDMNGDGFPDVIGVGEIQYTTMLGGLEAMRAVPSMAGSVRESHTGTANIGIGGNVPNFRAGSNGNVINSGGSMPTGNKSGSQMPTLGLSAGVAETGSQALKDLIDVNGDGLPDRVIFNGVGTDNPLSLCGQPLCVSLNLGYRFGAVEPWGAADIGVGAGQGFNFGPSLGFNTGIYDYAFGFSLERGRSLSGCSRLIPYWDIGEYDNPLARPCDEDFQGTSLLDVNGDGLLDRVKVADGDLYVAFNTGSGFAGDVLWAAGVDLVGLSTNTSLGGGAYGTVPIPIFFGFIIVNAGADYSRSIGRQEVQLRDIDGDGYADYLTSSDDSQVTVRRNLTGKTNLLKEVTRPLGALIHLDYQRDGNTEEDPYSRWNLVRVEVFDGQPGDGPGSLVTTYTYEGGYYDRLEREFFGYQAVTAAEMNGSAVYRQRLQEFANDSYYTKSLLTSEVVQDAAGAWYAKTENTYLLRDVVTGQQPVTGQSETAALFPMLVRTDRRFYDGESEPGMATYTAQEYDRFGSITRYVDGGDAGSLDDVTAEVDYSAEAAACLENYVVGVPVEITVRAGGDTLRHRSAVVDCATGRVMQVTQYLADASVVTDLSYLPNGNLQQVTGPANLHGQRYQFTYTYDPEVATHVTRVTDSFGYTSAATYDYRFGAHTSTTDVNGNSMAYTYDSFGRVTSITGPYEQGGSVATIRFAYHPEADVPWALTQHLDAFRDPGDPIETALFTDGLKRVLQTKKDAALYTGPDTPAQDVMIVSGRVTFDFVGRTVEQYYPVTEPLGSPGVFNEARDAIQPTHTEYDIVDRVTRVTQPDDSTTAYSYGFGPDRTGTTGFEQTITDANGVSRRIYKNIANQVVAVALENQGGDQIVWTTYTYDLLQQLTSVVDDQGNTTSITYDNLGRQTAIDVPDAGKTEKYYDLASNLVAEVTANLRAGGKRITYDYEYNRLASITYPDYPGNNVTYSYGAPGTAENGAGRILKVTSQAGSEERFYGKLGEIVKEIKTVATFVPGNGPAVYTTQFVYDTWGRLQTLTYPDGEVLTYRYDSGGQVRQAAGAKGKYSYEYARRLEYDKFDQIAFTEMGNGVRSQYSYRADNRRLETLQSGSGEGGLFQNLRYTYDGVGNVLELANDVPVPAASQSGGPTTQTYTYDDLYRLVRAEGSYQFSPDKTNHYQVVMAYDSIDNILSKQQVNAIRQPSGTQVVQAKTSYDWSYAYDGSGPHAATHIGDRAYTYDANGNQLGWTSDANGTRRAITWDEEDRIQTITDNGHEMAYKYDDAGQRVIKRGPRGETVSVNQFYAVRNGTLGTKQVFAGDTRLAAKLVKANAYEKDQYYYHADLLGSSNFVSAANGELYEHIEYFPSGETWVEEAGNTHNVPYLYTSKELDEETGLYYYGARYYDPRTSLWQSPDPAIEEYLSSTRSGDIYVPGNLNLYAYALQNPVKYFDPDGRKIKVVGDLKFIIQVNMAKTYLFKSAKARELWNKLESSLQTIEIHAISTGDDVYQFQSKVIQWDPLSAMAVPGGEQSPALGLIHEVGHAVQDVTNGFDVFDATDPTRLDPAKVAREEARNLVDESKIATEITSANKASGNAVTETKRNSYGEGTTGRNWASPVSPSAALAPAQKPVAQLGPMPKLKKWPPP